MDSVLRLMIAMFFFAFTAGEKEDICSYAETDMGTAASFGIVQSSQLSVDGACGCLVSPKNITRNKNKAKIMVTIKLKATITDNVECNPMMLVSSFTETTMYPMEDFFVCAPMPNSNYTDTHTSTVEISIDQSLIFHLYNPDNLALESFVDLKVVDALFDVNCKLYKERIMYDTCPCSRYIPGGATNPVTFNEGKRLMIGLVTAFIFILIVVAIIVGYVFYKRRQAKKSAGENVVIAAENKAYQGSKQSVDTDTKQAPKKEAKVSYNPDPNLNLKLQDGAKGHHGSRDSGLASSSNEPSDNKDKRLPFMQPQSGAASSLGDLVNMPENYPPLAGGGSQSSLDHAIIEPAYVTRQDLPQAGHPQNYPGPAQAGHPQNYPGPQAGHPQNYPGPQAGHQDNYPSLVGHGSQHSIDDIPSYHADGIVYAKPMKRQPERSASYEALNKDRAVRRAEEEKYESGNELNASRVTIETDI